MVSDDIYGFSQRIIKEVNWGGGGHWRLDKHYSKNQQYILQTYIFLKRDLKR